MELRERLDAAYRVAGEMLVRDGEVTPFIQAQDDHGNVYLLPTLWKGEQQKLELLSRLKLFFTWKRVTSYVQVSEAWVIERSPEDARNETRSPEECEDRAEVLVLNAVSRDEVLAATCPMVRDGDEVAAGAPEFFSGPKEGRLLELLPPKDVPEVSPEVERLLGELFRNLEAGQ